MCSAFYIHQIFFGQVSCEVSLVGREVRIDPRISDVPFISGALGKHLSSAAAYVKLDDDFFAFIFAQIDLDRLPAGALSLGERPEHLPAAFVLNIDCGVLDKDIVVRENQVWIFPVRIDQDRFIERQDQFLFFAEKAGWAVRIFAAARRLAQRAGLPVCERNWFIRAGGCAGRGCGVLS